MKSRIYPFFCAALILSTPAYPDPKTVAELQTELEALKAEYETRLSDLEARLRNPAASDSEKEISPPSAAVIPPAQSGFSYSGYFRSGFGVNSDGGTAEPFQAPGADAKYRLGNEQDTYVETAFRQQVPSDGDQEFAVQTRLAYSIPENGSFGNSQFSLREVFAEGTGVLPNQPKVTFWAGQRFYDRYDAHINDYYYLDMSGFGAGMTGWDLGVGELWVAVLGGTIDELNPDGTVRDAGTEAKRSLDLRWKGIPVAGGDLMLWASGSAIQGQTTDSGVVAEDSRGVAIGAIHEISGGGNWWNRFAILYGTGPSSNFRSELIPDLVNEEDPTRQTYIKDSSRLRVLNNTIWESGPWAVSSLLLFEDRDFGQQVDPGSIWISAGVRPVYSFNQNVSLALEAGVDHTEQDGGPEGELWKITLAPRLSPEMGFNSRPALRLFFTYADWSDEFVGEVAPNTYGMDSEGFSIGTQVEAWW
jgi:maltoporin